MWWLLMVPVAFAGLLFFRAIPDDQPLWHSLVIDDDAEWKPIGKVPPPKGSKLLVRTSHGAIHAQTEDRQHWTACATGEPIREEISQWALG